MPSCTTPARAREIDVDALGPDGELGLELHRLAVDAVDRHRVVIGAVRQPVDRREARLARMVEDVLGEIVEMLEAELVHHGDQALAADLVAGDLRIDVADHLDRLAHVGPDDVDQPLVHLAAIDDLGDRDVEPFLVDLLGLADDAAAADIDDVQGAGEQADRLAAPEGRRDDDDVVQMAGALPRIVDDEGVALVHLGDRHLVEHMAGAHRHRIDMARRAGDGLGQHAALGVVDAGREIARLARRGAEGGAHQRLRLLLDDGDQAVPHHLVFDAAQRMVRTRAHCAASCRTALPWPTDEWRPRDRAWR